MICPILMIAMATTDSHLCVAINMPLEPHSQPSLSTACHALESQHQNPQKMGNGSRNESLDVIHRRKGPIFAHFSYIEDQIDLLSFEIQFALLLARVTFIVHDPTNSSGTNKKQGAESPSHVVTKSARIRSSL